MANSRDMADMAYWIQLYNEECGRICLKKPIVKRLAHRAGVAEKMLRAHWPHGADDFAHGMRTNRWGDMSAGAEPFGFKECVPRSYAPVFKHNFKHTYQNASVSHMFRTFELIAQSFDGNTTEKFAAEYNCHVAREKIFIPDSHEQRGHRYLTRIDTYYTDDFDEALEVMQHQIFWAVVTKTIPDGSRHAVTAKGSRAGKLVCDDMSNEEAVRVSEQEFVNLVIPVVFILEVRDNHQKIVQPVFQETVVEDLARIGVKIEERRVANDSMYYTRAEFMQYYGNERGWGAAFQSAGAGTAAVRASQVSDAMPQSDGRESFTSTIQSDRSWTTVSNGLGCAMTPRRQCNMQEENLSVRTNTGTGSSFSLFLLRGCLFLTAAIATCKWGSSDRLLIQPLEQGAAACCTFPQGPDIQTDWSRIGKMANNWRKQASSSCPSLASFLHEGSPSDLNFDVSTQWIAGH